MVKGEHLRPLLGFGIVCVTAVLIMGTGLSTPSLSGIAAAPQVRAVPDAPDLVLGQTLDDASSHHHGSVGAGRSSDSPAAPAADQRVTVVLASLSLPAGAEAAPSPTVSSTPVHHAKAAKAVKHRKPHRNSTPVNPVPKPQATTPAPAPTPQPQPQPRPAPEPVHGSGHGMGHGVGHGSRNDSKHATGPGLVTTIVRHLDQQVQHGLGTGNHGDRAAYDGGHSHHHGDDRGPGPGGSGHGHYHHSGDGSTTRGQHR
jgi:hypothetical protein